MDGCSVAGGDSCEAYCRDSLVSKRCGVAGVNILIRLYREAQLIRHIGDIGYKLVLRGAAGDELAHYAAYHVEVDVQNNFFKLICMSFNVCLRAKKPSFLASAPNEFKGALVGSLCKMLGNSQNSNASGHIVVCALRKRGGIVVCGEDYCFFRFTGEGKNNVAAFAFVFVLGYDDFSLLGIILDELYSVLGVDVYA